MRKVYITENDLERLRELVGVARSCAELDQKGLKKLETELQTARIVPAQSAPADVITMHSQFRIRDLGTNKEMVFTLVYPRGANLQQGRISVMAPLGAALLGLQVGDLLDWQMPDGLCRLQILEVLYQPEAAGHFHL
jgi:regulator of nucleoside diphosphate kinase